MSSIFIRASGKIFPVDTFTFSGGEEHVSVKNIEFLEHTHLDVIARVQSSKALAQLLLISEVLNRRAFGSRSLTLPYFPYARQDRVTVENEAFSLEAVASLVGNLNYKTVTTFDLHSPVAKKYIKTLSEVTQLDIIQQNEGVREIAGELQPIILAPDKGALEKSSKVASFLGLPLMHAEKMRDPATGKIYKTHIPSIDFVKDQNVMMIDDICDGGATFIEIAKLLKKAGAKCVMLYVTHGIFSRGYDVFKGLIDRIYTTDTFIPNELPLPGQVPLFTHKVIKEN